MANNVVSKTVSIYIQTGDAQKAVDVLVAKEKKLKEALADATNPKVVERLKTELEKLSEPLDRAKKKLSGELSPGIRDVQKSVNDLGQRMRLLSEEDADFTTVINQYRQASKELDEQRGKVGLLRGAMKSFWTEAKTVATGVIIGNTVEAALQTVLGYVTGIVTGSAKISDELADIQRVTGLTKEEVSGINSELSKIDTRTSVSQLREITKVAGMLGVSKGDIVEFVKATDMLSVALGDELGSVDQITSQLGKVLNVFDGKITSENITHLGNAIVDLSNKGVATGGFLVDFTQRLSGIAKTANISVNAILGFGAGIEETGGRVESGATALQKIIIKIGEDVPKAAKIAGAKTKEEIDKFVDLFAKSPEQAILQFAKGLQANKSSFAEITQAFKDAGEDGARVITTLSTLGQRTEFFQQKIKDAGLAINGTSKITDAFRLKNETLGAQLDKLKKQVAGVFQSSSFKDLAQTFVNATLALVDVLKTSFKFISDHKVLIGTLSAIYLTTAGALNGVTLATTKNFIVSKAKYVFDLLALTLERARFAALLLYGNAALVVAGRITVLTFAQRAYNTVAALGAGPLGILLVAIGAVVLAFESMGSSSNRITAQMIENEKRWALEADINKKAAESVAGTVTAIKEQQRVLEGTTSSLDAKKEALKRLIEINPDFVNTLSLNAQGELQGAAAIDAYIQQLNKKALAEAIYEKKKGANAKIVEGQLTIDSNQINKQEQAQLDAANNVSTFKGKTFKGPVSGTIEQFNAAKNLDPTIKQRSINQLGGVLTKTEGEDELKRLDDLQKKYGVVDEASTGAAGGISKVNTALADGGKGTDKTAQDLKELADEMRKLATDALPDDTIFDRFNKDIQQLEDKFSKLAEKAHGNQSVLLQLQELFEKERLKIIDKYAKEAYDHVQKSDEKRAKFFADQQDNLDKFFGLPAKLEGRALDLHQSLGADKQARDELALLKKKGADRRDEQIKQLTEQRDIEISNVTLTQSQRELIEEKYRQKRGDIDKAYWIGQVQAVLDFASSALNIYNLFSQGKTDKENAELARDKAANDKKKKNLDDRLKRGVISQQQYDNAVAAIDKKADAREKEIKTKQFKRNQKAQVVQALLNGAMAVTSTLAAIPGPFDIATLGTFRAIQLGLVIATTAAQVATIASQKPPEYGTGGKLHGPSHRDKSKGMPVSDPYTGRVYAFMEGGEGIASKRTMDDSSWYNISGTPSQIISWLNGANGGVTWDSGATVRPAWSQVRPAGIDFPSIRKYATGGVFAASPAPSAEASGSAMSGVIMGMMQTLDRLNDTVASLQAYGIEANVKLANIEDAQARKQRIVDAATLK